jgi:hypothetical protein
MTSEPTERLRAMSRSETPSGQQPQRLTVDGYQRGEEESVAEFLNRLPESSKRKIRDALM